MRSEDYAAFLARVDAAVEANLCGCGCGQQIPARGPSPDFVNEKHQRVWDERRAVGAPAWIASARAQIEARNAEEFVECEDCDDTNCPCCHSDWWRTPGAVATVDETRTMKLSTLRRAIDKIMGKGR